jgi:hypothetical protein
MLRQAVILWLSSIGLVLGVACGKHPDPPSVAHLDRSQPCPDSSAQRDDGVDLGQDVRRGPRYRVDSAGRVDTLPPIHATSRDTARPGCTSFPDTSGHKGQR